MKLLNPAFNHAAGPDQTALRVTLLTALYWILLIDADERHEKEHRRVRDRQKALHREQQERRPAPAPRPPLPRP